MKYQVGYTPYKPKWANSVDIRLPLDCMVNNCISIRSLKHKIYLMIKPHYSVLESEEVSRDHLIDS